MLIRRLLANVIHNQQRRILTFPTATAFVSSRPRSLKKQVNKSTNNKPSTFVQKILQRTLQLILFGQRSQNVTLANTSLNRALKYTGLEMSSPQRHTREEQAEEDVRRDSAPNASDDSTYSQSIESLDEPGALRELQAEYEKARKEGSNCWLDFANKSCYIYLYRGGGEPSQSIAAFDLDGTIIRPKSNKRIPRSATDWDFFSVWTKVKLQQCLRDSQSRFVIFTNQNGVGLNIVPLDEVQRRIELVTRRLDIPCVVFMAVQKDEFRKPRTGMFQLFDMSFNGSLQLDRANSLYCGDAIGYPSHSDADIKFAQKLGFPFITPEKFVRGVRPKLVT